MKVDEVDGDGVVATRVAAGARLLDEAVGQGDAVWWRKLKCRRCGNYCQDYAHLARTGAPTMVGAIAPVQVVCTDCVTDADLPPDGGGPVKLVSTRQLQVLHLFTQGRVSRNHVGQFIVANDPWLGRDVDTSGMLDILVRIGCLDKRREYTRRSDGSVSNRFVNVYTVTQYGKDVLRMQPLEEGSVG
jgi:hypothetical protein